MMMMRRRIGFLGTAEGAQVHKMGSTHPRVKLCINKELKVLLPCKWRKWTFLKTYFKFNAMAEEWRMTEVIIQVYINTHMSVCIIICIFSVWVWQIKCVTVYLVPISTCFLAELQWRGRNPPSQPVRRTNSSCVSVHTDMWVLFLNRSLKSLDESSQSSSSHLQPHLMWNPWKENLCYLSESWSC